MAKKSKGLRARTPHELDPMIHERLRLGILSALVVQESLSFTELRELLQTTDGNLSVQARKLEEAGYVICVKRFEASQAQEHLPPERGRSAGSGGIPREALGPAPGSGRVRAARPGRCGRTFIPCRRTVETNDERDTPRSHHHGRERPMGGTARLAALEGARSRRARRAAHRRGGVPPAKFRSLTLFAFLE